ncbi:MAG: CPBP family intramembrane metalloprotease [Propionibacteriaceae bacterium]|nr:CPBP family intramembrane metalloprotease [Propionibacteriaceae bacterium]
MTTTPKRRTQPAANRPQATSSSWALRYEPPAGVDYTKSLADTKQRPAMMAVTGLAVMMMGLYFVNPGISGAINGIGWLLRGRPGTFDHFAAVSNSFGHPEGVLGSFLGIASFVVIAMLSMRYIHRQAPRWLASVQPGMRWRFMLIVAIVAVVVFNLSYWATSGRSDFHWAPMQHAWLYLLIIVLVGPLQAAGEEYFFRGYMQQLIGAVLSQRAVVVLVSAVLFTAVHGTQNLPLLVDRFVFGALLGTLVVMTGGLEAAIAMHAVNNIFAFGYPVLSGTLADARTISEVGWGMAGVNILAYVVIAGLAYLIGRAMKVATRTPM